MDVRADDEAGLGMGDRRRHQLGPGKFAEFLARLPIGLQAARYGDRLIADVVDPALQDEAEAVPGLAFD